MLNLDYKCLRDILNYIHKHLEMPTFEDFPSSISVLDICNANELSTYNKVQIKYAIIKLIEAEFIQCHGSENKRNKSTNYTYIDDITIKGYDFLTNSTNEIVWKRAISSIRPIGMISLTTFCTLMNKIALKISMESLKRI